MFVNFCAMIVEDNLKGKINYENMFYELILSKPNRRKTISTITTETMVP